MFSRFVVLALLPLLFLSTFVASASTPIGRPSVISANSAPSPDVPWLNISYIVGQFSITHILHPVSGETETGEQTLEGATIVYVYGTRSSTSTHTLLVCALLTRRDTDSFRLHSAHPVGCDSDASDDGVVACRTGQPIRINALTNWTACGFIQPITVSIGPYACIAPLVRNNWEIACVVPNMAEADLNVIYPVSVVCQNASSYPFWGLKSFGYLNIVSDTAHMRQLRGSQPNEPILAEHRVLPVCRCGFCVVDFAVRMRSNKRHWSQSVCDWPDT